MNVTAKGHAGVGKLTGKIALITGADRGLGRAYVLRLARLGADVVINDINLRAHEEFGRGSRRGVWRRRWDSTAST